MRRIRKGDRHPGGRCVFKQLADGTIAVKVTYRNDQGEQLYAVYDQRLVATGEHLTLEQVVERGN